MINTNDFNEILSMQVHGETPSAWALMLAIKQGYRFHYTWNTKLGVSLNKESLNITNQNSSLWERRGATWNGAYEILEKKLLCYAEIVRDEVRTITIHGYDPVLVEEYYKYIVGCEKSIPIIADKTIVRFWHFDPQDGPTYYTKKLGTPDWPNLITNYAKTQQSALSDLLKYQAKDDESGRLILLRGTPGTGKSFYLRTLMQTWKSWCSFNYIIDVDKLFTYSSYMIEVFGTQDYSNDDDFDPDEPAEVKSKHNLIILEDCGELIAKDAKAQSGQSLSKMLNLADGILGQGSKCLILISTNEELKDLHNAVTRPGRCLANLEFPILPAAEALEWQEQHKVSNPVKRNMSLAELYDLLNKSLIKGTSESSTIGFTSR